jgi:hypothetical protein
MPTFFDSTADAAEASEALRGWLTRAGPFDQPAQMYGVIGDLSSGMRSLRQVLDQIADVHERKAAHAFNDDGKPRGRSAGRARCCGGVAPGGEPRRPGLRPARGRVHRGGADRWHPDPAVEEAAPSRWVNVVFLQGDEADRPLRILGELGHVDAVDYLAQWDYGDETTQAALENGYVYDEPGEGTNDRVMISGDYALVVNPHVGYVSLLRRYTEPEAEPRTPAGRARSGTGRAGAAGVVLVAGRPGSGPICRRRSGMGRGSSRPRSRRSSRRGGWCGDRGSRSGCTPPSWWHRRRNGASSASSAAKPKPASTPSSEGPRSPQRRRRPRGAGRARATIYLPKAGEPGAARLRTPGRFHLTRHQDTSATLAGAYPFVAEGGLGADGVFVGQDLYSGGSFVYDPWVLYARGIITAPNVVLAGIVGSGKSSLAKSLYTRSLPFGRRVYVPGDPKGEHTAVANAVGGGPSSSGHGLNTRLNPLDEGHRPSGLSDEQWASTVAARGVT